MTCEPAHNSTDGLYIGTKWENGFPAPKAALLKYDKQQDEIVQLTNWHCTDEHDFFHGVQADCPAGPHNHEVQVEKSNRTINKATIDGIPAPVLHYNTHDDRSPGMQPPRNIPDKIKENYRSEVDNSIRTYEHHSNKGVAVIQEGSSNKFVYIDDEGENKEVHKLATVMASEGNTGTVRINGRRFHIDREFDEATIDNIYIHVYSKEEVGVESIPDRNEKLEDLQDGLMPYESYKELLDETKTVAVTQTNRTQTSKENDMANQGFSDILAEGLKRGAAAAGGDVLLDLFEAVFTDDEDFARMILEHEDGRDIARMAVTGLLHEMVGFGEQYIPDRASEEMKKNFKRAAGHSSSSLAQRKLNEIRRGNFEQLKNIKDALVNVVTQYTQGLDAANIELGAIQALQQKMDTLGLDEEQLAQLIEYADEDQIMKMVNGEQEFTLDIDDVEEMEREPVEAHKRDDANAIN